MFPRASICACARFSANGLPPNWEALGSMHGRVRPAGDDLVRRGPPWRRRHADARVGAEALVIAVAEMVRPAAAPGVAAHVLPGLAAVAALFVCVAAHTGETAPGGVPFLRADAEPTRGLAELRVAHLLDFLLRVALHAPPLR